MSTADLAREKALAALRRNAEAEGLLRAARAVPWWRPGLRQSLVAEAQILLGEADVLTAESFALTARSYYEAMMNRARH